MLSELFNGGPLGVATIPDFGGQLRGWHYATSGASELD